MPSRNSTTAQTMTMTNTFNGGGSAVYSVLGGGYGGSSVRPRSLTDEFKLSHNATDNDTLMK